MSSSRRSGAAVYEPDSGDSIDEDDDDMSYEPSRESQDTHSSDSELLEFMDAFDDQTEPENGADAHISSPAQDSDADTATDNHDTSEESQLRSVPQTQMPRVILNRNQLLHLLGTSGLRYMFHHHSQGNSQAQDDAEDDEDLLNEPSGVTLGRTRSRRRRARGPQQFPKVPSDKGRELMESGIFGTNERLEGQFQRTKKLAAAIMRRELGLGCPGSQRSANRIASQGMIPSSKADTIINYDNRCYSGQFSDDGNFFFSCAQDFKVRMYDTSNPYKWTYYKTVDYPYGQWTITDASLSPDNKFLAYSSIRSVVCLAPTDPSENSDPYMLDFSDFSETGRRGFHGYSHQHFGIWSIRFSGDGREIVAGTSDRSVYVYDIETRKSILRICGHEDDVNAVCFGDRSSPHILFSGSDDTTLKVWDRRSMGDGREAGVFLGHTEGLTYVDSKGDGRYVLSNGKDQTMKLWDLRKMTSPEKANRIDLNKYSTGFDYRFMNYNEDQYRPHPHDCSLVTFRGHKVLKTLIRCHFSPPGSTDSRYVYSGSEDGGVYIYNLDATLASKVDVNRATLNTRPRTASDMLMDAYEERRGGGQWKTCVRDASWHPNAPVIAATSWNGYGMTQGTCTIHTWNDGLDEDEAEPHMGLRVNAKLQHDEDLYDIERLPRSTRAGVARTRGALNLFG